MSNKKTVDILFVLNIIQPITIDRLKYTILHALKNGKDDFTDFDFNKELTNLKKKEFIDSFKDSNTEYYFVTRLGRRFLPTVVNKKIDFLRLYLLKKARRDKVDIASFDGFRVWGGVSSVRINWNTLQTRETQSIDWFRFFKKSADLPTEKPSELAFFPTQYIDTILKTYQINLIENPEVTIACILGVSTSLIESMCKDSNKEKIYYRTFQIPKKSGGTRNIEAPRVMMKVVQRFIADYILVILPVHKDVYSYTTGKSIVNNAILHNNKKYLYSMDIEDFFGSISYDKLRSYFGIEYFGFFNNKFKNDKIDLGEKLSRVIIDLCTKDGSLPQGAPTSPILSNAILYNFDEKVTKLCEEHSVTYTRYADDISISGDNKDDMVKIQKKITEILQNDYGFKINQKKNKFASKSMRHKVTGIVVNEKVKPSRHWMKKLQQDFNYARKFENKRNKEIYKKLQGRVSYLQSFPYYQNEKQDLIIKYKDYLQEIKSKIERS